MHSNSNDKVITVLSYLSYQHLHTERAYELQVSDLTKSLANLEAEIRRLEEEKHNGLQDLAAVRDLCTRLEGSKDQLQRQLTAKSLDYEKVGVLGPWDAWLTFHSLYIAMEWVCLFNIWA